MEQPQLNDHNKQEYPPMHTTEPSTQVNNNIEIYKKGLEPWVGKNPKVLILGTMPGDESIRQQVYYANTSKNSFWKIMYSLFSKKENQNNKEFIISQNIALWDCAKFGIRKNSTDREYNFDTIKPNDIYYFLEQHPTIKVIILNGKGKGSKKSPSTPYMFKKFFFHKELNCQVRKLSSTSNSYGNGMKLEEWSIIKELVKV